VPVIEFANTGLIGELADYQGIPLTAANVNLLKFLQDINGQDAYSSTSASVSGTNRDEYLALPEGYDVPVIDANRVGSAAAAARFRFTDLAQIYALNKQRAPPGENAVRYALVRVEAVKAGWVANQREIVRLPRVDGAGATYLADINANQADIQAARAIAFVIPLIAEHTFRTMGHHYITGNAADYEERYRKTLRACLLENLVGFLRPSALFHHALHWVTPQRSRNVLVAQIDMDRIPDALKIRYNAAPAGTAIVTTTAAVLKAMESSGLVDKLARVSGLDITQIITVTETIKQDPAKYHRAYFAYGIAAPTEEEVRVVNAAREVAITLAPITQAYINVVFRTTQLANARALMKHAEVDPQRMRLAERFFKNILKREAVDLSDLFNPLETAIGGDLGGGED
jgi:hypothetical protein